MATEIPLKLADKSPYTTTTNTPFQSTGGNGRGYRALDLQVTRAAADQVAVAYMGALLWGESNRIGQYASYATANGSIGELCGQGNIMRHCDTRVRANVIHGSICPDARII